MSGQRRSRSPVKNLSDDCYLFIGNLPTDWNYTLTISYLRRVVVQEMYIDQISYIYLLKDDEYYKGESVIEFLTASACKAVANILMDEEVEGKKLEIVHNAKNKIPVALRAKRARKLEYEIAKLKKEELKTEPFWTHETYGLSVKFLSDLNITPPLTNRVFVSNLDIRVTETKLREVFSYAGHVVTASISKNKKTGKVLYDHPVEAVQAVSMFNNKELYSKNLHVKLDMFKAPTPILPEGLASIGLGLGRNGEPMTGVRHTIELEPLKKLLLNELNKVQNHKNPGHNNSDSDNPNQHQNNSMWSNNQNDNNQNDNGNPLNNVMQILQQNLSGNLGSLGVALQQAMYNQAQNQTAFGNVPSQNAFGVHNAANQGAFGVQNVANQGAFGNQVAQPQSRFDVPPSALPLAQNAIMNQNDLVQQVQQLAYQQNASMWQSPQAPKSRFDIPPPSGMAAQNLANAGQGWNTGIWSQTQTPSQTSNYDTSRSDTGYGSSKINSDEFDVPSLNDTKKEIKTSDMLLFTNLPSSVTSQALVNKMTEVGALKFAEITGQGRAIVRFQQGRDAERCLKLYDRSKVDGQVIAVKFV